MRRSRTSVVTLPSPALVLAPAPAWKDARSTWKGSLRDASAARAASSCSPIRMTSTSCAGAHGPISDRSNPGHTNTRVSPPPPTRRLLRNGVDRGSGSAAPTRRWGRSRGRIASAGWPQRAPVRNNDCERAPEPRIQPVRTRSTWTHWPAPIPAGPSPGLATPALPPAGARRAPGGRSRAGAGEVRLLEGDALEIEHEGALVRLEAGSERLLAVRPVEHAAS